MSQIDKKQKDTKLELCKRAKPKLQVQMFVRRGETWLRKESTSFYLRRNVSLLIHIHSTYEQNILVSVGKLGYEPVVWHRIHSKVKLPEFYSVNGALSAKDPSKNFSKMTEEVKVSDTTPDPPIEGKKTKPVCRIKDKNLAGVSTNYLEGVSTDYLDKMELRNNSTYWVRTMKGCLPG